MAASERATALEEVQQALVMQTDAQVEAAAREAEADRMRAALDMKTFLTMPPVEEEYQAWCREQQQQAQQQQQQQG